MNKAEIISFYERELNKLISEIELYKKEENIWHIEKNIANSAGNLTLHLIGNLHTFIGKEIGNTTYIRNRELEFLQKNVPRKKMIASINDTLKMIEKSLNSITNEDLKKEYPVMKFPKAETTEFLLIHLINHLSYHLGQINYHRRLIDG